MSEMDIPGRILVVEDDPGLASLLDDELTERGYGVATVGSVEEAWDELSTSEVDLVLSDLRLPGVSGDVLLEKIRERGSPPAFIVITGYATVSRAVECLKAGADDFLTKPVDLEHLAVAVERAIETRRLRELVSFYEEEAGATGFHGLLGRSRPMRVLFDQIRAVAKADGPVLIQGESGVGKELVARALHMESGRSGERFVAVNCAGVPEGLLESEFFGHTKGAFTGASSARKGLFEAAGGGTLFLDEISEMTPHLQAKLLRVLQERVVRPIGGNVEHEVDVRVLAATNRDLTEEMETGSFREDLFYRLEAFTIVVPPLRERGEDLDLLTAHFVARHAERLEKEVRGLSPEALALVRSYPFPGNVRELENAMERSVTFCRGEWIEPRHLPPRVLGRKEIRQPAGDGNFVVDIPENGMPPTLEEVREAYTRHILERLDGNKSRAASALGIGRRTLYRRLDEGGGTE